MLKLKDIKDKIIIKRTNGNIQYFSNNDLEYWETNIKEIRGFKSFDQYYFILDNVKNNDYYNYKIKAYNIQTKKINTIFESSSIEISKRVLHYLQKNVMKFNEHQQNIIDTGELKVFSKMKKMIFSSEYLNKEFILYIKLK